MKVHVQDLSNQNDTHPTAPGRRALCAVKHPARLSTGDRVGLPWGSVALPPTDRDVEQREALTPAFESGGHDSLPAALRKKRRRAQTGQDTLDTCGKWKAATLHFPNSQFLYLECWASLFVLHADYRPQSLNCIPS